MEVVRFDMQKIENPEIEGVESQQGALAGYDVRGGSIFLRRGGVPAPTAGQRTFLWRSIISTPRAGEGRIALQPDADHPSQQPAERKPSGRRVSEEAAGDSEKNPRSGKGASPGRRGEGHKGSAVRESETNVASGRARIRGKDEIQKWTRLGLLKTHPLDVVCVGAVDRVEEGTRSVLSIKAMGRGSYQRTCHGAYGFPRGFLTRRRRVLSGSRPENWSGPSWRKPKRPGSMSDGWPSGSPEASISKRDSESFSGSPTRSVGL